MLRNVSGNLKTTSPEKSMDDKLPDLGGQDPHLQVPFASSGADQNQHQNQQQQQSQGKKPSFLSHQPNSHQPQHNSTHVPPQELTSGHSRSTSAKKNELLPPVNIPSKHNDNHHQQGTSESKSKSSLQQFHRKSIGDWDFIKTIGAGSMGKVKLAQHNTTKEICAVKIIPRAAKLYQRAHAQDPPPVNAQEAMQRQKEFEKEVARDKRTIREGALGRFLYHPFICRLYEMVPMTNHYYMLFEYVEGGQMLDYIVAHGSLKEKHARKFARGIVSALDYCHRNNVVHRDLKIENIMINEKGDIKIIDFGLSNLYSPKTLLKTYCGSLYFAAPELLSAKPYVGPEVDVWSFGVVLYVLVCGKVPFDDQSVSVLHEKIKKGNVEYPSSLSRECVSLLSRMLVVDPTKRASLFEVIQHPWMNKGYDYRVPSYVPKRQPLSLPLDPEIIKTIASFDLGSVQSVSDELTNILSSVEYQMSCENWYKLAEQGREYMSTSTSHVLPDPTGGFHPLVSIYYLVDEMKKRKKAKEEALKAQMLQKQQTQQQQQQAQKVSAQNSRTEEPSTGSNGVQPPTRIQSDNVVSFRTQQSQTHTDSQTVNDKRQVVQSQMANTTPIIQQENEQWQTPVQQIRNTTGVPSIAFPERIHTSTIPTTYDKDSQSGHIQNVPELNAPVPEQRFNGSDEKASDNHSLDPGTKGGVNSMIRRMSSKKTKTQASEHQQPIQATPLNQLASPGQPAFEVLTPDSTVPQISIAPVEDNGSPSKNPMVRRGVSMKVTAKERLYNPEKPSQQKAEVKKVRNKPESSSSEKEKFQGFVPVEYLPPLPNINVSNNLPTPSKSVSLGSRKLHPTARAKSVGGHVRKQSYYNSYRHEAHPLPNNMVTQNSDEILGETNTNGFFDDVTLDDVEYQEIPQLTEEQIIEQYNNAEPNSMPSVEHCKTLFLKGFFSVQTTSTKPLPVIRYNIINVLSKLGVKFQEVKGGFVCAHAPSLREQDEILNTEVIEPEVYDEKDDITSEEKKLYGDAFKSTSSSIEQELPKLSTSEENLEHVKTPSRQPSLRLDSNIVSPPSSIGKSSYRSGGSTHRRKFSLGNSILNSYKKKNGSNTALPPNTPAAAKVRKDLFDEYEYDEQALKQLQQQMDDDSVDSLNGLTIGGGSDMLISSKIEQRARHQHTSSVSSQRGKKSPLKFEIHIVKVPLVGLYGVQFKKLLGNTWNYKALASQILTELNL
jgi:protein-serine/threonine kinase